MPQPQIAQEEKSFEPKIKSDADSSGFDCNICLEFVQDPVVTLCGHLYCWPCIYKWIHFNSIPVEMSNTVQPQCPVCKAEVSVTALVPLYGRGKATKASEREVTSHGLVVPERPPAPILSNLPTTSTEPFQYSDYEQPPEPHHPNYVGYGAPAAYRLGGTNAFQPIIDILGEMVYSTMPGESIINAYEYPNSYNLAGANTPRVRRQLMRADRSLSRLCVFFFCGMILCLLLF